MSMADVFAPVLAAQRAQVMRETWGHLAPVPRRRYVGYILFAHGAYGDIVPIRANFHGLSDSPWFFSAMMDFLASRKTAPGRVYRFEGIFMAYKNGKSRFFGKTRSVKTP